MNIFRSLVFRAVASLNFRLFLFAVTLALPGYADSLDNWERRNPLPRGDVLYDVAYGNGTFVAVGWLGYVLTSSDGVSWTPRNSGVTSSLTAVTYANGKFVAVGDPGAILTSPDGVSWTTRTSGTTQYLSGVSYGNGTFVIAGFSGKILTSPDGITWTNRSSGTTQALQGITFGNGIFVAVGGSGTILTSTDGITWASKVSGTTSQFGSVAYGNGLFVAGDGSATIRTSPDGTNWTSRTTSGGKGVIRFLNGAFVACAQSTIYTSADAISWASRFSSSSIGYLSGAGYGNGKYVVVGDGSLITSSDSVTWTSRNNEVTQYLQGVAYGGGKFVAAGSGGSILTSADGASWVRSTGTGAGFPRSITYGSSKFVAVGGGGAVATSADGITWASKVSGTTQQLQGVAFGNGGFVAVGISGTIVTSPDGNTWTTRTSGTSNPLYGVGYGNGLFVAVGNGATVLTSPDGSAWTPRTLSTVVALRAVTFANGIFVGVGFSPGIVTSLDGVTWTVRNSGNPNTLYSIAYANGTFVAVGYPPYISTSTDGVTWTNRNSGVNNLLYGVCSANGTVVAVGTGGTILTAIVPGTSPIITGVSPNPVPGSNSAQTFVINGTNFDANCSVTLRDLSAGVTYANRTKVSQTSTSITLNPNFGTPAHTWSVEVINPGSISSGQYQFSVTSPASLVSLTVSGPSSLAAGSQADYTATATFSSGPTIDVTSQAAWSVSGGPSGTQMSGRTLVAGSGSASTATVIATYAHTTGTRTASKAVAIGSGLSILIGAVTPSYQSGSGNSLNYNLQAIATVNGGTGNIIASWKLDNVPITGTALALNTDVTATPASHAVKVTVTDGTGATASATMDALFPKALQANEQFPKVPVFLGHAGTLYAKDAVTPFVFDPDRKNNGLVVIIHGMDNRVSTNAADDWMKEMADAIQAKLGTQAPNIILYDWNEDADTLKIPRETILRANEELAKMVWPPDAPFAEKLLSAASIPGGAVGVGTIDIASGSVGLANLLIALRPKAGLHGNGMADYLHVQILAGNVNPAAPIHLIGHSAGGFVASNCGKALLDDETLRTELLMPTKLQVTTLDTPFLRFSQILGIRDRAGKFERYVSSHLGEMVPGVVILKTYDGIENFLGGVRSRLQQVASFVTGNKPAPGFQEAVNYHSGSDIDVEVSWLPIDQHVDAHDWYSRTIQNPTTYEEGFYYAPFPGGHSFPGGAQMVAANVAAFTGLAAPPPAALSGFLTFGNVTEPTVGTYALIEQGNAGIYGDVALPMNVSTVKFRVQFTQPGDGDFIEVIFGDHLTLAVIADGPIVRAGPVEFEMPVVAYGGETGQLLFKLNGVGADNGVAVVDNITITTADDADGDGLTFAQETTLGTDPRYYDTDADGLDDAYETTVSLTNPLLADSDGDGNSDPDEITAGTNALNPQSNFKIVATQRLPNGNFVLSWPAVAGISYRVLRSPTPDFASFDVLAVGIEPAATPATYTDSTLPPGTPAAFYRVQTE